MILSGFGVFWLGEAMGTHWPGGDLAIVPLAGVFLATGLGLTARLRRGALR